jgi:hypothetical protein
MFVMRKLILFLAGCMGATLPLFSQVGEAPNSANSAQLPSGAAQADKMMSNPVNLYTGVPNISIPIYSYKSNSGLSMGVSIDYAGGGVGVSESPSLVGLGWYLNSGGIITRTVRGMPDDMSTYGYLYAGAIPADWRNDGSKYYHDSLDTQQDVFQFNFPGHAGKFMFGKNGQIIIIPDAKIKIIPSFFTPSGNNATLKSFRIITEDGLKYDFEEADGAGINMNSGSGYSYVASGYYGVSHRVCWSLSRIISAFNTDTIKFTYQQAGGSYGFSPPQITFVNNSTGGRKTPYFGSGYGSGGSKKPLSIELPDKTTISFLYNRDIKYNDTDYVLSKIKISDTAFRFGYLLEYADSGYLSTTGHGNHVNYKPIRVQLKSVTPFTAKEKQQGYRFEYNAPDLPRIGGMYDTIQNKKDHWGFLNGAVNGDSSIPKINSYTWGADRNPDNSADAGSLSRFYLPTGGSIYYKYELNDHYPYTKQQNTIALNLQNTTQTTITLNQVLSTKHQLGFFLDKSISRTGAGPISGSGTLNLAIKSTNGVTTYATGSISLYELFYSGLRRWTFNLPNGTYMLETSLSGGTSTGGAFPVSVEWENKNLDNTVTYKQSGGLRVKSISRASDVIDYEGSYEDYKYVLEDGRSSGYLGEVPRYDFPFREEFPHLSTTIDYTAVSSAPLGTTGFAQIGYSRVEIQRKSFSGNLGKVVHEFTDLKDVNSNTFNQAFPYTPFETRSWALGMPKRISVYDSAGTLVKRSVNTYQVDTVDYTGSNFKSMKMGHSQTTFYAGTVSSPSTTNKSKQFIADDYYPSGGRAYMTASTDTLYYPNSSYQTSYQNLVYDTNYNVTKIITSYDRNRGLEREQRMYYPYNYTVGGGVGILRDSAIISQTIAMETWITGDANPRMIDGAVTSFRQVGNGDIKPDTIYAFESNKPVLQSTIGTFSASALNRNQTYLKPQSYFVSYDSKGNLTEAKNLVTGQSSSSFIDYDQQYTIATASNAVQSDIAYTSFESAGTGNWTVGSSNRDLTQSMSGKKSYNLSNGNISKSGLNSSVSYLVTFWLYAGGSATVNGASAGTAIATQNGWYLYSKPLSSISSVTISGSGLIDEVRLHPKDANMQSSTYEPLIGVTTTMDANNGVLYTEYDNLNRAKLLRDKDKNIVKRFDYSDTVMSLTMTPLWVGIGKQCAPWGYIDSLYKDMNIHSDSAGYVKAVSQGYRDCSCPEIASNPQYKVVNGTCEEGVWSVTSSVYKKVIVEGVEVWRWVCTYRWCFSDGSQSTYYSEGVFTSPCSITCYIEW